MWKILFDLIVMWSNQNSQVSKKLKRHMIQIGKDCMKNQDGKILYHRRWYRMLCPLFKLMKSQSSGYLFDEISPERQLNYGLRYSRNHKAHVAITNRFSDTYFQDTLFKWNLLEEDSKTSITLSQSKKKSLKVIKWEENSVYHISDIVVVRLLTNCL